MKLHYKKNNFRILLVIFFVSLLLRIPNLNRPLSTHYEHCTAITLVQLEIWEMGGIGNYFFLPAVNYPGKENLNVNNGIYEFSRDKAGNYYYLSFPPFYLLFTYYLLKVFHLPISPLTLQIINIVLHFITLLLILKISSFFTPQQQINVIGLAACLVYSLSPAPLWFHTNVYIMYPFVVPFYLSTLYFYLKLLATPNKNLLALVLFSIFLFIVNYTEWIGILLSIFLLLQSVVYFVKSKNRKIILIICTIILSTIGSGLLLLVQESNAIGLENSILYHLHRYSGQSGVVQTEEIVKLIYSMMEWYGRGYVITLLFLFALIILCLIKRPFSKNILAGQKSILLMSLVVPVFCHHILLRNFTMVHQFSTLIDGLAISFLVGFMCDGIVRGKIYYHRKYFFATILSFVLLNSLYFFLQYLPGRRSITNYPYNVAEKIGTTIRNSTQKRETVFLLNYNREFDWQLIWYAKKSIVFCTSEKDFYKKALQTKIKYAKLFKLDSSYMQTGRIKAHRNFIVRAY